MEREGDDKDDKKEEEDKKKKSIAFKASSSSSKNKSKSKKESSDDDDLSDINDEAMALFVRKMEKFMKKKGYGAKKEKKMTFQKKKGGGYVVTWDSNGSSDSDDSSDDGKKSIKKALASIAINNKPSIFDTPLTCLMAKPTKVKYDVSDDDEYESDACRSDDDDDEYSKEELMDMLEQVHTCFEMKRKECKELHKRVKSLEQSFDKLNATHESLKKDHDELGKAHSKLEKAHSSLLEQAKKELIVTCDVGSTCDLINESLFEPIIVTSTNPSCSTFTSTSPLSDGFTCDASLMVENETLKKEVNELTHALGRAYGGEDYLLMCLGRQRASLYKEGLGYTPGKAKWPLLLIRLVL